MSSAGISNVAYRFLINQPILTAVPVFLSFVQKEAEKRKIMEQLKVSMRAYILSNYRDDKFSEI